MKVHKIINKVSSFSDGVYFGKIEKIDDKLLLNIGDFLYFETPSNEDKENDIYYVEIKDGVITELKKQPESTLSVSLMIAQKLSFNYGKPLFS